MYLVMIETIIVSDLMPKSVLDLAIEALFVVGHRGIGSLNNVILSGGTRLYPARAAAMEYPRTAQATAGRPATEFARLFRSRHIGIGNRDIIEMLHIAPRHLIHSARYVALKQIICDVHTAHYTRPIT